MKNAILIFAILLVSGSIYAQETETSTYYLIRHAEKDRSDEGNKNPDLTAIGLKRAVYWSEVFKNVAFDAVYSTNYNRTIQTATPTGTAKNLEIQFYDPKELFSEKFRNDTKGKIVLIVGHSNTTPLFANAILGKSSYDDIADNNNSNLYIVSLNGKSATSQLLYLPL